MRSEKKNDSPKRKIRWIIDPRDKEWDLGALLYNLMALTIIILGSWFAIYFISVVWSFTAHHHH